MLLKRRSKVFMLTNIMSFTISRLNEFIKEIPENDTINHLKSELGRQGVKVVYEKSENFSSDTPVYNRIMFGTFRRSCTFNFPGIILSHPGPGHAETKTQYRVISVPPIPPITQYKSSLLHNHFKRAKIIKVNDGTTVTLYFYRQKWVVSTHRGFEVNSFSRLGKTTYDDVLNDIELKYLSFNRSKLDRDKCYTIGFKHKAFHPFWGEPRSGDEKMFGHEVRDKKTSTEKTLGRRTVHAWYIQSIDLKKFNASDTSCISYNDNIGLPHQEYVDIASVRDMFRIANNAYGMYMAGLDAHYGFLVDINNRRYLVESSLLKNIRQLYYSNKFNSVDEHIDKNTYIIIYYLLDADNYDIFKTLFPQHEKFLACLEKKIDKLVVSIRDAIVRGIQTLSAEALAIHKKITTDIREDACVNIDEITDLIYHRIYNTENTLLVYNLWASTQTATQTQN